MSGYVRNDTPNNIATGNVINAADLDGEFDAIQAAFVNTTGHTHDGNVAEGAPITKIGPVQDIVATASALSPKTDNTIDLGSSTLEYKDLWIDGTANIDSLVADTADINAGSIDGTSVGLSSPSTGAFTTLSASSTTTLSGLTASTALALNASKQIVSVTNTGTGDNVLATSPTLISPNLGTPTTLVLTNATGLPSSSITGTLAVSSGGTGQTTIAAKSVFVANTLDTFTALTPAAGQSIRINAGNTAWESYTPSTGDVSLSASNAFTGANTFYNSTGQTFGTGTSTEDGIVIAGRAGGSSSYRVTLTPTTLGANRTLTLPDASTTVVGTDTSQTLTNKTIEAGTFTNGYTEETVTANTGTAYTIDLTNGTVQILTLTDNCVYTFPTVAAGKSFLLIQKQDGTGSRTVTWPSVTNPVKWPGGTAPTLTSTASKADVFAFTSDGTNWIGRTIAQNYTL